MKIRPLFSKYQKLLVAFANTEFGRDYLNVSKKVDLEVAMVTPDGIHYRTGRPNEYHAIFHSRAPYFGKLGLALTGLEIASSIMPKIEKPEFVIPHFQGLIAPQAWLPDVHFALSRSYNPDSNPEARTVDGACQYNEGSTTYSVVHDAAASPTAYPSSVGYTAGQDFVTTNFNCTGDGCTRKHSITRGYFLFDTTTIVAGSVISSCTFNLYCLVWHYDNPNIVLVAATPASNTNLVTTDFHTSHFGSTYTQLSSVAIGEDPLGWSAWPSVTTMVTKGGITKIGVRTSRDIANTAATEGHNNHGFCNFSDAGSNKPYLAVTYTLPSVRHGMV